MGSCKLVRKLSTLIEVANMLLLGDFGLWAASNALLGSDSELDAGTGISPGSKS